MDISRSQNLKKDVKKKSVENKRESHKGKHESHDSACASISHFRFSLLSENPSLTSLTQDTSAAAFEYVHQLGVIDLAGVAAGCLQ